MNARTSPAEMRDALIAEKTAAHAATIRAAVAAGEPPIGLIADGVTDLLCDAELAQRLVRTAACAPAEVGPAFFALVEQVIAEKAEVEAEKEVKQMEAAVSSTDRQRMQNAQVRAEVAAAYGGNPPMLEAPESAVYEQNMGIFGYGGMG